MFYQLDWQQMEKNWKVICAASFYFIVTHYSRLCSLISASSSLSTHGEKKVAAALNGSSHGLFSWYSGVGGVSARITAKEQLQLNVLSFISISMQRFEVPPPSQNHPYLYLVPTSLQANNQPQRKNSKAL